MNIEKKKEGRTHKGKKYAKAEKDRRYRLNHPDKCAATLKRWYQKNRNRVLAKLRKDRERLTDSCVRNYMAHMSCVRAREWPQSLVELRRQLIKTRRLLHEIRC